MCSGGGGGDGGASEREQARQQRIDQATKAVNAIFGQGGGDDLDALRARVTQAEQAMPKNPGPHDIVKVSGPYGSFSFEQQLADARKALADAEQNESMNQSAKAAREQIYGQVGDDTRNYYSKQLGEDAEGAQRDMRFTQARNGTLGSSQAIDMQREFDRRNDRGLLEVANRSDSAVTGLKTNDEKTRIDLISRIVNGADQGSATSSALAQLSTNTENARQNGQSGRMANVFAGGLDAWKANQTAQGEDAARKKFMSEFGAYFDSSGGGQPVQGTVTRG
jgi:hypothetical protein